MNEKDIEEPLEFSNINSQKQYFNSNKKNINSDIDSLFTVVIHFPNKRTFSFDVPQMWNTKKLLSFINSTFKPEFQKSSGNFIFHGNLLSPFSESPLKDYLKSDKINHIIITLKKLSQENINENNQNNNFELKTNTEVFKSDEFIKMESNYMDDYFKIFKNNSLNNFPLMNPAYNHRREQLKKNSILEKLEEFEPIPLEEFPFRNYFQLNIIFKCFNLIYLYSTF